MEQEFHCGFQVQLCMWFHGHAVTVKQLKPNVILYCREFWELSEAEWDRILK